MSDTPTSAPPALPGGFAAISKYNPHLWTPDQLRAIFVARQRELADLTQTLAKLPAGEVGQHCILVGARGMGKSTLMQRLALAVEDDAALKAAWLPLRFPEEQYTVNTLAQFWANVLDSLADALERRGLPTQAIDATAERLAALPVAEQGAATLQTLREISHAQGQRLLLLVDNTDLLLHNLGTQGQWALRQVLQSEPQLLWVGGSYQSLEANSQYHDAFLDFFRVLELRPLTLEEMQQALLALAQSFGGDSARDRLAQQLLQQPERLPTLRMLSGGNPRTTVMLYELLASGQAGHVRSDLEALLDSMTPLYKARLDALADLPRKLLAHILGHWAPISLAQLAEASQVPKTSISPQLQRLELEGLIQKTKLHGTTRSGYQAAERFFNIWYLMRLSPRRQRTRLGWLVEFMRLWFSGDELCDLARFRLSKSHSDHPHDWDYDSVLADALPEEAPEKHGLRWNLLKQLQTQREALNQVFDFNGLDQDFKNAEDYLRRARALPERLRLSPYATDETQKQQWTEAVMGSLILDLSQKEQIARNTAGLNPKNHELILNALSTEQSSWASNLGHKAQERLHQSVLNLDFFPDIPDSALAFQQIRHVFAQDPDALRGAVLLHAARQQDEFALKSLELAQTAFPKDAAIVHRRADLLHEPLNRYNEAEEAYKQAISLDKTNARSWNNLGNLLKSHLGRYDEAEQAYRKAIDLDEKYASPWNNLGGLLQQQLSRFDEAEAAYLRAIALDSKKPEPWFGLGNLLQQHLDRYEEAEHAYRQAITANDRYAPAWNNLGGLLQKHLRRYTEAEQAYRKAIALNEKDETPWDNLGNLLQNHLNRPEEAEQAYRRAISLSEKDAKPWNNLGGLLQEHLHQYADAEHAYRQAIALDGKYAPPWCNLGYLLHDHMGRHAEAEQAYRHALVLDPSSAHAASNLAQLLWEQGRLVEAGEQFEKCAQLAERLKPKLHHLLLQANLVLKNQQRMLQALDQLAEEAQQGGAQAGYRLREQVWETTRLGLGERLADWMQQSLHAQYLQPMIQALYTLAGAETKLQDLPAEVQLMADTVVQEAQNRLRRGDAAKGKPAAQ